jgi:hypothetical protein
MMSEAWIGMCEGSVSLAVCGVEWRCMVRVVCMGARDQGERERLEREKEG